ncbi:uncharacterized protein LOC123542904 [Mercenaria mercenaria]|uniref:uncharacterized protein LOC123542904 n=1 Tax=Mercenaria mercenaria TaxID=6596 RepID=UPI00234E3A50|nr:uncharacterized protein LOC123542904 [Mercenaria mercenaria]
MLLIVGAGDTRPPEPIKLDDHSREQLDDHSREQLDDHSREQLDDQSREELDDHSREQLDDHSREQLDDHSHEELDDHSHEQLDDQSHEQLDDYPPKQLDDHSHEQLDDHKIFQKTFPFFLDNSKLDEDELVEDKPEIDLEEAANKVNESLTTAEELAKKLSDLNQDIIEWLVNYANTKASNKGKKRLEKSLDSAKNELSDLSEKLLKLQTELEEKDEKFQQVAKQLETKTQEAVRYKTAAEVAKKSAQDNEAHTSVLQDEITRRDEKIVELRTKLSRLEINLTETQFDKEMSTKRLDNAQAQTKMFEIIEEYSMEDEEPEKLAKLQEEVEHKKMAVGDAEREMEKLHREQLASLHKSHQLEITELKKEHEEEVAKLTEELLSVREQITLVEQQALEANSHSDELRAKLIELQLREPTKENIEAPLSRESSATLSGKSIGELSASEDEHPSRQKAKKFLVVNKDSRQSTKDTKKKAETLKPTKAPSKSPNRNIKEKAGRSKGMFTIIMFYVLKLHLTVALIFPIKNFVNLEKKRTNERRQANKTSEKSRDVIRLLERNFPNAFDLDDEESWASVPPQHVQGRFLQYRQLGRGKIKELEEQLQVTLTKTHRKVNSLKSQFNEHKSKWEAERKILIEQVEQAQKLQTDAEKEADAAMTQLEEFINEQEKLEDEEEQKRQEIIKTMSRPGTVKRTTPAPAEPKSTQDVKAEEQGQGDRLQTENSEQELKNLMQQTDDAKAQKNARQTGAISAPPAVEPDDAQAQKLQQQFEILEEDFESKPVTSREKKSVSQSGINLDDEKPVSPPKEAFRTPRSVRSRSIQSNDSMNIDTDPDEGVATELSPCQSEALNNLKSMMAEDNLNLEQQKTLESLRSVIRSLSAEQALRDIQLERTVTILSLASQIAQESVELGVLPDSVFDSLSKVGSRAISAVSGQRSVKGSAVSRLNIKSEKVEEEISVVKVCNLYNFHTPDKEEIEFNLVKPQKSESSKTGSKISSKENEDQSKGVKNEGKLKESEDEQSKQVKTKRKLKETELEKSNEVKSVTKEKERELGKSKEVKSEAEFKERELEKSKEVKDEVKVKERELEKSKEVKSEAKLKKRELEKSKEVKSEVKLKEKELAESVKEYSFSGSGMADFLSSRGDSFSASLPRTMTSSEWRRFSPDDPFTPTAEKKQKQPKELRKDLTPEDLHGAETKMSAISVVISPKKKSRPVTMQQMLYGEKKNLEVAPAELEAAIKKLNKDALPRSRSPKRPGSTKAKQQLSQKRSSPLKLNSVIESRTNSLMSLENNASSVSEIQTNQSDLTVQNLQEGFVDSSSDSVNNFKVHLAQLPSEPDTAKVTKFQCVSKVLTFEIEAEHKSRSGVKKANISKGVKAQAEPIGFMKEEDNFYNLDKFSIAGNSFSIGEEFKGFKKTSGRKKPSRSRSFGGFAKIRSRSTSHILGESLPGKVSLSNRLSLLTSRNKYHVGYSEFGDKSILNKTETMYHSNVKSPKENLFPPKWKFRNDTVAIATPVSQSDLQNSEVKEITSEELDTHTESIQEETTAKSPHSRSSRSSQKASRLSAKSKSSASHIESPAPSELLQPKSPSTFGRMSPDTTNRTSPVTINRSPRTTATPGTLVSEVQRPVSISSVQPRICDSPPPPLHRSLPPHLHKETQTDDWLAQIEHEPVSGNTEDEVRQSSAKSRASLRSQFKSRLDETRQAVEERRTKSPVIAVLAQKSIDDELIIEDDDDLPIPDDLKEEVLYREDTLDAGTSPPPSKQEISRKISVASRKSTNLAEHPVVNEYLRAYTGIHNFKEAMSRVLVDKDQMSASQILTDLDVIQFNKDNKVVPQISNMTENIYYVLNEVSQVVNSVLQNDRGPVVSSLMMGMSRDATQRTIMREKSGATGDMLPETRGSQRTVSTKAGSVSTDAAQYQELQAQYEKLQNQMSEDSKKYEEQQKHNVVVMMEMQDTINQLQRELSALGKQTRRPMSESVSAAGAQNADSAIMFTRLDSERNAKIMKKAVNERKLDPNRYKEAMVQMDEYVNLPAQRLAHLVRKYVHHCRMKEIEENVQKSQSLNENVFELFDKMEALQNQRAKRWADRMDEMGIERYRLANMLMETLDSIEQESGLFLIKPMYSYRGREPKEQPYSGKITRPFRPHRTLSPLRDNNSAHAPAPTPASNVRPSKKQFKMIVMGLDTVLAFELELAERPKSTQSYKTRPKSGLSDKQRPQSRLSEKLRSESRTSDNELTASRISENTLTGLSVGEDNLTGFRQSNNDLTGSGISEHTVTGLGVLGDNLTGFRQNEKDSTGSNLTENNKIGTNEAENKPSNIPNCMSVNESIWLETKLSESVERPSNENHRPNSRLSSCARPESMLSDIFTREIKYNEKIRPKTGIERCKSYLYSRNRPKTSVPTSRSGKNVSKPKSSPSLRRPKSGTVQYSSQNVSQAQYEAKGPLEGDSTGLMGSSVGYIGAQAGSTWKMADSQLGINNPHLGNVNTPRILELDINRMMIGQNTISAQIGSQGWSNDRLVNAANNNLRAYMTVNRPGPNSAGRADRPHSGSRQTTRPSSSPTNHSASTAKRVRLSDVEIPTVMSQSQPLPPIGGQDRPSSSSRQSPPRIPVGNDLPESPPGSSLRHSPLGMDDTEVTSPVK